MSNSRKERDSRWLVVQVSHIDQKRDISHERCYEFEITFISRHYLTMTLTLHEKKKEIFLPILD